MHNQRKQQKRTVAVLLAIVSAAGLVVAALGPRWLANPDTDRYGIGLRTFEDCRNRTCLTLSCAEVVELILAERKKIENENRVLPPQQQQELPPKPWKGWPVVGMITVISSVVTAASMLVAVALVLARKRPDLPILPTTIAVLGLAVALINGCLFVATKPPSIEDVGVGWTFFTFGGGIVTGLASVFPLNRQIRPIDVELGAAASTMSWEGSRDDA